MYFVVVGKTPGLSWEELQLVGPRDIVKQGDIITFTGDDIPALNQLAGSIKWGKIIDESDLEAVLADVSLIGVADRSFGMQLKKTYGIKRFKEVSHTFTDEEVKDHGCELICLADGQIGLVEGWQDIGRFSVIDFDKPARGMQIGMMPAKLTQILLNIGICAGAKKLGDDTVMTVYDPFCGFGTTGFVANSLGYHFIGSDINITPVKQNQKRRGGTIYARDDRFFTIFKHDVRENFTKPFLEQIDVIVTEGWLGPVVTSHNTANKGAYETILQNIEEIVALYSAFLSNMQRSSIHAPIVMTVPVYSWLGDVIEQRITGYAEGMGYEVRTVGEVYQRKGQTIGRRVLLLVQE